MNKPLIFPTGIGGWCVWQKAIDSNFKTTSKAAFGPTWREAWANWCAKGYNK